MLTEKYKLLNEAYCETYCRSMQGRPIYLDLDEDIVLSMSEYHPDLYEVNFDEVLAEIAINLDILNPRAALENYWMATRSWHTINRGREINGQPPCVLFLAATALAASYMGDGNFENNSYYPHLSSLLNLPRWSTSNIGSSFAFNDSYLNLWEWTNNWIESTRGKYGEKTSRQVGNNTFVGTAISQVLVRNSDLQIAEIMFQRFRVNPNSGRMKEYVERSIFDNYPQFSAYFQRFWLRPDEQKEIIDILENQVSYLWGLNEDETPYDVPPRIIELVKERYKGKYAYPIAHSGSDENRTIWLQQETERRARLAKFVAAGAKDLGKEYGLSDEQMWAFLMIESMTGPIYLHGKAGSGKTHLLKVLQEESVHAGRIGVVAPTGLAAQAIDGQTIHKFFALNPNQNVYVGNGMLDTRTGVELGGFRPNARRKVLSELEMLIIDEASMLRADVLDTIDRALKLAKNKPSTPFGGVKLVLFGDMYQLPPVVGKRDEKYWQHYLSPYFASATVWNQVEASKIELRQSYRQGNLDYQNILEEFRNCDLSESTLTKLRSLVKDPLPTASHLFSTNKEVNAFNAKMLGELDGQEISFPSTLYGSYKHRRNDLTWEPELLLKPNAPIIFTKNDLLGFDGDRSKPRWANGTRGVYLGVQEEFLVIEVAGNKLLVERDFWVETELVTDENTSDVSNERKIYKRVITGVAEQYPIRLAWGVTIHKAQGATLDSIHIDLGPTAFSPGLTYVAFSRVRELEDVTLEREITLEDFPQYPEEIMDFMEYGESINFYSSQDDAVLEANEAIEDIDRVELNEKVEVSSDKPKVVVDNRKDDILNKTRNFPKELETNLRGISEGELGISEKFARAVLLQQIETRYGFDEGQGCRIILETYPDFTSLREFLHEALAKLTRIENHSEFLLHLLGSTYIEIVERAQITEYLESWVSGLREDDLTTFSDFEARISRYGLKPRHF